MTKLSRYGCFYTGTTYLAFTFDLFGNVSTEAFATRDENRTVSEEVISSVQVLFEQCSERELFKC